MNFAVDGSSYGTLDCSAPCCAWMVPVVPDDSTHFPLEWKAESKDFDWEGTKFSMSINCLVPELKHGGVCPMETINGVKFAVLSRGLLCLGSWILLIGHNPYILAMRSATCINYHSPVHFLTSCLLEHVN